MSAVNKLNVLVYAGALSGQPPFEISLDLLLGLLERTRPHEVHKCCTLIAQNTQG